MEIGSELSRRTLLRVGVIGLGAVALGPLASACSSSSTTKAAPTSTTAKATGPFDELLAGAKSEGGLNLIAVPDGAGSYYAEVLAGFREMSGIDPATEHPEAGSENELTEVRDNVGKPGQPDVIDVGVSHAIDATGEGLLASFTPEGWSEIPSAAKDPDGHWVATYYGLIGIVSNPGLLGDVAPPASLDDLRNLPPDLLGFSGDPRTAEAAGDRGVLSSAEAFAAVWTVALANGGSLDDIGPGIDFFAELVESGVLDPGTIAIPSQLASGDAAISMINNFAFARADSTLRNDHGGDGLVMHFIGSDRLFPNYAAQAVVADSPHPDAARLWVSYLISDDGARAFLQGGAIPVRFATLHADDAVGDEDLANLGGDGVTAEQLAGIEFPLPSQIVAAQKVVDERWGPEVMGE